MIAIERELVAVIYGLYALECVHWLDAEEVAFTKSGQKWKRWQIGEHSFTLLRRMPYAVNPLRFTPGWIVIPATQESRIKIARDSESLNRELGPYLSALQAVSIAAALFMLILVPAAMFLGLFLMIWQWIVLLVVLNQLAAGLLMALALWRIGLQSIAWRCVALVTLSPLTAARCLDLICKEKFMKLAQLSLVR